MADEPGYRVLAELDERGRWIITVPELPGVVSFARRLADVERSAREGIAAMTRQEPDAIKITHLVCRSPNRG